VWYPKNKRCENELHNYPLHGTFAEASVEAAKRMHQGWKAPLCPDCNLYGWLPPQAKK
jgi:hypothetical protein